MDGTDPLKSPAWWQFAFISNELSTPKLLICPADKKVGSPRKVAGDFSDDPRTQGMMAPSMQDLAVSYTIGLDALFPPDPSIGLKAHDAQDSSAKAGWTNSIHMMKGNVLSLDGGVEFLNTRELNIFCDEARPDNGSIHFLVPQ